MLEPTPYGCSENGDETSRTVHVRELTNWRNTGQ